MAVDLSDPHAFKRAREAAGVTTRQLAAAITQTGQENGDPDFSLSQQAISFFEGGNAKTKPRWLRFAAEVLDRGSRLGPTASAEQSTGTAMVSIRQIDLEYGMGATFSDGPIAVEVMDFPKVWIEAITSSPPAQLTWARGRGDSMAPTILDGDLVLLDRSQRRVTEQDALWAYTIGDLGAIKRLRIKGGRIVILSDNPSVPTDEEPIDEVNIVARVIFIGRRT
jgi:phage repressor protein C with HTH and peptisase S24 domain